MSYANLGNGHVDVDKVHAVSRRVLTHQCLVGIVVAIDNSLPLFKRSVRRERTGKRTLGPRAQRRDILASEAHRVTVLAEFNSKRAWDDPGLALLQAQPRAIDWTGWGLLNGSVNSSTVL
jgi:hypothetical protein